MKSKKKRKRKRKKTKMNLKTPTPLCARPLLRVCATASSITLRSALSESLLLKKSPTTLSVITRRTASRSFSTWSIALTTTLPASFSSSSSKSFNLARNYKTCLYTFMRPFLHNHNSPGRAVASMTFFM